MADHTPIVAHQQQSPNFAQFWRGHGCGYVTKRTWRIQTANLQTCSSSKLNQIYWHPQHNTPRISDVPMLRALLWFQQHQLWHLLNGQTYHRFLNFAAYIFLITMNYWLPIPRHLTKNEDPFEVWPLRSQLSRFNQSMWAANHFPTKCNKATYLHFSQLKT